MSLRLVNIRVNNNILKFVEISVRMFFVAVKLYLIIISSMSEEGCNCAVRYIQICALHEARYHHP